MKGTPTTLRGWVEYHLRSWVTQWITAEVSQSTEYRQSGGRASW